MLTELRIRNFAIIDRLTLPLAPGFNVLTGETGAGKSIIVGALGLLLGERASADLIRTGSDRATVEGVFDVASRPELRALLDARGIALDDDLVVLRREIAASGRTRGWVNDAPTTAAALAEVGRALVDLHGQHEAQTLLDEESQRGVLDAYAGAGALSARVREHHEALSTIQREIDSLARRRTEAEQRADYLRHVAREIEEAKLVSGEDTALEDEARRLEHAEELRELAESAAAELDDGDQSVLPRLGRAQRALASLQRIDPALGRLQELLDTGFYALEELARALAEYARGVERDPARLAEVERRRDVIYRLGKKYGGTIDAVLDAARRARQELDLVDGGALDAAELERRRSAAADALRAAAGELTAARATAARTLAREVDAILPSLGMPDGRLDVRLAPRDDVGPNGAEDVSFLVSLNVGHDARPLARVASGGELARVMLALKSIFARLDRIPTLVFDEVDAGIGGRVALQVGDAMRLLAVHRQVLAITHLPQIAARAHHHIVVAKDARGGVTTADTRVVDEEERVAEVARMLGGDPESDVSRAHARELLSAVGEAATAAPSSRSARRAPAGARRQNRAT